MGCGGPLCTRRRTDICPVYMMGPLPHTVWPPYSYTTPSVQRAARVSPPLGRYHTVPRHGAPRYALCPSIRICPKWHYFAERSAPPTGGGGLHIYLAAGRSGTLLLLPPAEHPAFHIRSYGAVPLSHPHAGRVGGLVTPLPLPLHRLTESQTCRKGWRTAGHTRPCLRRCSAPSPDAFPPHLFSACGRI